MQGLSHESFIEADFEEACAKVGPHPLPLPLSTLALGLCRESTPHKDSVDSNAANRKHRNRWQDQIIRQGPPEGLASNPLWARTATAADTTLLLLLCFLLVCEGAHGQLVLLRSV